MDAVTPRHLLASVLLCALCGDPSTVHPPRLKTLTTEVTEKHRIFQITKNKWKLLLHAIF